MTIINDKKNIFYADKRIIGTGHSSSSGGIMFCSTNQTGGSTKHCRIYGFRITTGSMAPAYKTDELLLVKQTNPEEIKEGDVISFYSTDPALDGAVNTHRVMEIEKDGDHWFYTTKGDANNVVDAYTVDSEYLIGKVIGSSLMLGKLARLVSNPLIFIPIILLPLAVILITNLARTVSLAKKIAKDEEEAAVKEAIQQIREQRRKKNSEEKSNEVKSNEINSDDNKE